MALHGWSNPQSPPPKQYTCGYCGVVVGSDKGYIGHHPNGSPSSDVIYICSFCRQPSYISSAGKQTPGAAYGNRVEKLPPDIETLYDEARRCMSVSGYTAVILCCRKLLMHVAVANGAPPGRPFIEYVDYLAANGYVPPSSRAWVDHIRSKGNEANHEIKLMSREEAEGLLSFVEMLLKLIYEFPAKIPVTGKTIP